MPASPQYSKFANLVEVTVSLYLCRVVELGVSLLPRRAQAYIHYARDSLHELLCWRGSPNTELCFAKYFCMQGVESSGIHTQRINVSEMWERGEQLCFICIVLGFCFLLSDGIIMLLRGVNLTNNSNFLNAERQASKNSHCRFSCNL